MHIHTLKYIQMSWQCNLLVLLLPLLRCACVCVCFILRRTILTANHLSPAATCLCATRMYEIALMVTHAADKTTTTTG